MQSRHVKIRRPVLAACRPELYRFRYEKVATYRLVFDLTGENELTIEVAIPWANRLIGDEELPPEAPRKQLRQGGFYAEIPKWVQSGGTSPHGRVTFVTATTPGSMKGDPLQPSGLLGPVTLQPFKTTSTKAH